MHAVQRHFERYPIAQQLLTWDRRISPAWLRVLAPIITLLHAQGLRGRTLVQTFSWLQQRHDRPDHVARLQLRAIRPGRRWPPPRSPPMAKASARNSNSGAT